MKAFRKNVSQPSPRWRTHTEDIQVAREELYGYLVTAVWKTYPSQSPAQGEAVVDTRHIGLAFCSPKDRAKSTYDPGQGVLLALKRAGPIGYTCLYDERYTLADYVADAVYGYQSYVPEALQKAVREAVWQALHGKPSNHIRRELQHAIGKPLPIDGQHRSPVIVEMVVELL